MPDEFTNDDKEFIIRKLELFPRLNEIIIRNQNFFRKYTSLSYQHIPESERDFRLEFTLANILKNHHIGNFSRKLHQLEDILSEIPIEIRRKFSTKLVQNFISTFSEIEVYYKLFVREIRPDIEPIISANGNTVEYGLLLGRKYFLIEVKTPRPSQRTIDYIDASNLHERNPEHPIGAGFVDIENQRFVDVVCSGISCDSDPRSYPREYSRVERLIDEEFIGRNLRNRSNLLSSPIILIINFEYARTFSIFSFDVIEELTLMMQNSPPPEIQGIIVYSYSLFLENSSRFIPTDHRQ